MDAKLATLQAQQKVTSNATVSFTAIRWKEVQHWFFDPVTLSLGPVLVEIRLGNRIVIAVDLPSTDVPMLEVFDLNDIAFDGGLYCGASSLVVARSPND